MFTDFLFPSCIWFDSNAALAGSTGKFLPFPDGDLPHHVAPKLAPIPDLGPIATEFSRLTRRSPTPLEGRVLALLEQGRSTTRTGARDVPSKTHSMWIDGMLADTLPALAAASGASGARVLLVSPFRDHMQQCQLRLSRRAPVLPLVESARSATERRPMTAWATPDELDLALVSRVFGGGGPEIIFVEEIAAASPLFGSYRPSFKKLAAVFRRYPAACIVASAHRSSLDLRVDVAQRLGVPALAQETQLWLEQALISSPRLSLHVQRLSDEESDLELGANGTLSQAIAQLPRPALILCGANAQADAVHQRLSSDQFPVHRYHSGLSMAERAKELLQFSLPGRRAVMVAVSGFFPESGFAGDRGGDLPDNFGPGYLRRDLRSLIHLTAPSSLEQYVSELKLLEAGPRSIFGPNPTDDDDLDATDLSEVSLEVRDTAVETSPHWEFERTSFALLFYHPAQLEFSQSLLHRRRPFGEEVRAAAQALLTRDSQACSERTLSENGLSSRRQTQNVLKFLVDAGLVGRANGTVGPAIHGQKFHEGVESLIEDLEQLRTRDPDRSQQVNRYLSSSGCRRVALDLLLGRASAVQEACGICDACGARLELEAHQREATQSRALGQSPRLTRDQSPAAMNAHVDRRRTRLG